MKDKMMERRSFLKYTAVAAVETSLMGRPVPAADKKEGATLRKALQLGMLPEELSDADKFELAKKCGFDAGNVIILGFAQDWIHTLGKRIVKIHLKDFKRKDYQWTNLLDGDVNWKQVRLALDEVSYRRFLTPELRGGDEAYLTDLSKRIDHIIAM